MVDRSVEKTGSIDKLTEDKLQGVQGSLLKREKHNLCSGDKVRQVKQKHSSGCIVEPAKYVGHIEPSLVFKYHPGLEDVFYRDNDTRSASTQEEEFGIRQIIFTTGSNSAHKHLSLSELEAIVLQCLLSWRQVVRQLQASTSSNSAHKDRFSLEFVALAKYEEDIKSSSVLKYYHRVDVLYCDNGTGSASTQEGESEIRRPEIIFATSSDSISAHKYHSSSELETIVRQYFLRWRQVVGQLEESTSSNSTHKDRFFSVSALSSYLENVLQKMVYGLNPSNIQGVSVIDRPREYGMKYNFFHVDISHHRGYVDIIAAIIAQSRFHAGMVPLPSLNLPLLCSTDEDGQNMSEEVNAVIVLAGDLRRKLKEGKDQYGRDKLDTSHQIDSSAKTGNTPLNIAVQSNPNIEDLRRKLKEGKDQYVRDKSDSSAKTGNTPLNIAARSNIDNMQNLLKEGKDKDVRDLLGIPNKTLLYYAQKLSNSNSGIYEFMCKFDINDPKGTFENNSLKSTGRILVNLLEDYTRKYGNLFKEARSRVSQARKHTDLWDGKVLASRDKELFPEGSFADNVQKLMKKDLNRLGAGGNGEIVEAFYQRKHLVIKKTLLRELELSVVPKLEHKNLLPWFAIISGEKSERRPGQVLCYQIMPKMTEDLSASIRTIGGSIHDHILSLQQDSVPKAAVSLQAELMRRNTSVVFRNVLEGLQYLHEQGLVHRDIKASNILLKKPESCAHSSIFTCDCTPHWEVKVADFDSIGQISVLRERAAMRGKKKLKSGRGPFLKVSATGTSGYRAPEIFEEFTTSDVDDPQYFSPASDIWALGGVGIHVVMGFCTPRKQYQFGLMMLAHRGMLKADERDDIISRTLGLHHIREGFPGEKWKDMTNFVSRPLQIDWYQRPSAKELLQDPFIQRYNTTPGLNTVVNETATLDTATPSTIELSTEPQQIENRINNRNDISELNSQPPGNQHC